MASVKATFTLDPQTIERLNETAERQERSKSEIVRMAIRDYSDRADRLSERERRELLRRFDEFVSKIPERPVAVVDEELGAVRAARRGGGRGGRS
jgi:hypothetical protein